jgi:hypothetical protein
MAFFAGKSGTITIGGTARPLTDWSIDVKTDSLDVTNFTSGGWQELLGGIYSIDISASGPYNGTSGVTQGTAVALVLDVDGAGAGPSFSGNALVTSVKIDQSVKDVAKISYSASSSGSWTATP